MDRFLGKFELYETENFDEFMKALGVNFVFRKLAAVVKSETAIHEKRDDGSYHFKSVNPLANAEFQFQIGIEFIETQADGKKTKSKVTYDADADQIIHTCQATKSGDKDYDELRYLTDDGSVLVIEVTCDGVKSTNRYKRVAEKQQ